MRQLHFPAFSFQAGFILKMFENIIMYQQRCFKCSTSESISKWIIFGTWERNDSYVQFKVIAMRTFLTKKERTDFWEFPLYGRSIMKSLSEENRFYGSRSSHHPSSLNEICYTCLCHFQPMTFMPVFNNDFLPLLGAVVDIRVFGVAILLFGFVYIITSFWRVHTFYCVDYLKRFVWHGWKCCRTSRGRCTLNRFYKITERIQRFLFVLFFFFNFSWCSHQFVSTRPLHFGTVKLWIVYNAFCVPSAPF